MSRPAHRTIVHLSLFLALGMSSAFLQPVWGQGIPVVGTDSTLEVATWNLTWFGSDSNGPADDPVQLEHARRVISESAIDLWALQEIADPADFAELVRVLGAPFKGRLATEPASQQVGFIYNADVLTPDEPVAFQHILTQKSAEFAGRPPLRFDAQVELADSTFEATFITLHMKAFSDDRSYRRRVEASRLLKNYLDLLLPRRPVVVLGDFNDLINTSIRSGESSPYLNFLQDPFDYRILTRRLEAEGRVTYCSNASCTSGSAIDHILITDELFLLADDTSVASMSDLPELLPSYRSSTSDHLPVHASFYRPKTVSAPASPDVLQRPRPTLSIYPNPVTRTASLSFTLPGPGPVAVRVFDLIGREVWRWNDVRPAGSGRVSFDATHLPAGLYVAHLRTSSHHRARPLIRAPE